MPQPSDWHDPRSALHRISCRVAGGSDTLGTFGGKYPMEVAGGSQICSKEAVESFLNRTEPEIAMGTR